MNRPKRQHTVPKFYLEHFTDPEGKVWSYDLMLDQVRAGIPQNTAVETNFYSVKDESGEYVDLLEKWLADVEGKAAQLYPKLLSGEIFADQERADFAVFLSSLHLRSPAMIRAGAQLMGEMVQHVYDIVLQDRKRFDDLMDKTDAKSGKTTPPEKRDEAFDFAKDKSRYVIAVDRKIGLKAMGAIDRLTKIFFQMNWMIIECRDQHLITSDNPVIRVTPHGEYHPIYGDGGFLNENVLVTVPLSPSMMLELTWADHSVSGIYQADKKRGRLYNRQRALFSERYLYASRMDAGIQALGRKHASPGVQIKTSGPSELAPVEVRRRLDD